jgi:hypothetical protein
MMQWLPIVAGVVTGISVVAAALFFAFGPYFQARPRAPFRTNPTGAADEESGYDPGGSDGFSDHSAGMDGHGHVG